ncbi:MAG: succinate dehydrogenase, cytochrome b556 subunit [Gammaproteobacteria bacterium]|nr:succinate dehydrogenase, cytochrome b556 subunit [Gammaproteobacteria bacterium]
MSTNRPVHLNLLKIKMPVTAVMSIIHRITGTFMVLSIPILIYLFAMSLSGEQSFKQLADMFDSTLVRFIAAVFIWFLAHHFLAGIRFLLIDIDIGVMKQTARTSAMMVNILGGLVLLVALYGLVIS